MIFGSKRKKATDAALVHLRPLIALAQHTGGISTDMYFDPYIVGYLNTTAYLSASFSSNSGLGKHDLGSAIRDAFTQISNMDGLILANLASSLIEKDDPEFGAGASAAMVIFRYLQNILPDESAYSIVRSGHNYVDKAGIPQGSDRRVEVADWMIHETFLSRVQELRGQANV